MGLPWVRLDSGINQNDKVVRLLAERDGYRAFTVYICGLAWSGAQSTDGHIPAPMLTLLHGQRRHAELLVTYSLWDTAEDGWDIRNWAERQELAVVTEAKAEGRRRAALKANCARHHPKGCKCWQEEAA